jgi:hypothetical protein
MNRKYLPLLVVGSLMASSVYAANSATCDSNLTNSLHECERIVGSLRPDKAGQMRVFASDGSEYTAGQALWMKGQLRLIAKACTEGDSVDAARRLADVLGLLNEHHHAAS